jgi:hypothetical protein
VPTRRCCRCSTSALAAETDQRDSERACNSRMPRPVSARPTPASAIVAVQDALGESSDPNVRQLLMPLTEKRGDSLGRTRQRGARGGRNVDSCHRTAAGVGRQSGACLYRSFARLDPAAGGTRPGDHLRGDGGDQHGARRTADGRRLFGLGDAERFPGLLAERPRLVSAGRHPGGIPGGGSGRRAHGADRSSAISTGGRWRRCSRPGASPCS